MFIASEVMFFVAWFWAYFNAAFYPTEAIGHVWPPASIETFNPWELPFINTLILLLSGTTVTWRTMPCSMATARVWSRA